MLLRKFNYFLIILLLYSFNQYSQQSRSSLEKERDVNLVKIQEAETILKETEKSKNITVGKLNVINKQIRNRQSLISNLRSDIKVQSDEIILIRNLIISLKRDLRILNNEYSDMIYSSYKSRSSLDKLTYIFSSKDYNQMFRRFNYIFQYSKFRKNQIIEINKVYEELEYQENNLSDINKKQKKLLDDELSENNKLQKLKGRQRKIISDLNKKQRNLRKEIAERKVALENLDKLIRDIIRREKEALLKNGDDDINLLEITEGFEANIGKFEWPVKSGFISNKFGEHPHPIIKNIKVKNDGIDIQTSKSSQVHAIYDGKVSTVAFIPGMNNVVIINHGEYYTLYAKLKNLKVQKGDIISEKQVIADLVTNNDGITQLQFQIWKNNIKLNPENWIIKK
ncbi:MAG: peptidoglycan DD-metalloendopeptidase family protein [Bacteroidota bacterium]|jgi:septal ring factor EnvC (AmiA/AmiB activator)|nr:peptidoglycan DD-metalloendopeptidase family protein [Bacteroidota bacterium]|tara:strand:+ start:1291 stop:2478 length:1188 start_codon:yes stop_codon:yes gene_type:complete